MNPITWIQMPAEATDWMITAASGIVSTHAAKRIYEQFVIASLAHKIAPDAAPVDGRWAQEARKHLDIIRFHLRRNDHVEGQDARRCTNQIIDVIDQLLAAAHTREAAIDSDSAYTKSIGEGIAQGEQGGGPKPVAFLRDMRNELLLERYCLRNKWRTEALDAAIEVLTRQPASPAEPVAGLLALAARWEQQADECECDGKRIGETETVGRELLRDAAQYRQSAYQVRALTAAKAAQPDCTEPNRADCPRHCIDFCNKSEEAKAAQPESVGSERQRIGEALTRVLTDPDAAPNPDWNDANEVDRLVDAVMLARPAESAAPGAVDDSIAEYDRMRDGVGGCSDGGCVIKTPVGMHTNGGCKCWTDKMKAQRMMHAGQKLRAALARKPDGPRVGGGDL
jgi:hypothetical protein